MRRWAAHLACSVLPYSALHVWLYWLPLSTGGYLAFTDLWDVFLPAFLVPFTAWSSFEYGGFPAFADPQTGFLYPVKLLLASVNQGWTLYLLLPYIAGSALMYAYIFLLTSSRLGAFAGGLAYGLSEAMQERVPHASIVQGYMWLPALLVAVERFRVARSTAWFVAGAAIVAVSILAGHSQTAMYVILVAGAYALVGGVAARASLQYFFAVVSMFGLGGALTFAQNLPLIEASPYITRDEVTYAQFTAFSMTARDALAGLYPMIVHEGREVATYVGLAVLLFAIVGARQVTRDWRAGFWAVVAAISIAAALGDATPVAGVLHQIPLYDKFRIASRHLIFATFGVIVLAGYGLTTFRQLRRPVGSMALASALLAAGMAYGFWVLWEGRAGEVESHTWQWLPEGYYQTTAPLQVSFFALTVACALILARWPSRLAAGVLVAVLTADLLGSQFVEITARGFRFPHVLPAEALQPSVHTQRLRAALTASGHRVVALGGVASDHVIGGQFSKVWGMPSASGYNSMVLSHFNSMTSIGKQGDPAWSALGSADVGLDLMGVRYLLARPRDLEFGETFTRNDIVWSEDPLRATVGRQNCDFGTPARLRVYPEAEAASAIALVASLRCADDIPQGTHVGSVRIVTASGEVIERPLRAGVDIAERAHERPDVKGRVRHQLAEVFGEVSEEALSLIRVELAAPSDIDYIEIDQRAMTGWMEIEHLTVIGSGRRSFPQHPLQLHLNDDTRWHVAERFRTSNLSDRAKDEDVDGEEEFIVFENRRALPRAWVVPQVMALDAGAEQNAVRLSVLPDGRRFDPRAVALVGESDVPVLPATREPARVLAVAGVNGRVRIAVGGGGGFMVVNEVWYPGWTASIDGQRAAVHRANIGILGVVVPEGQHLIELTFKPRSQYIGAALSLGAALVLGAIALTPHFRRRFGATRA